MPSSNQIDMEYLAKLYRESDINKIRRNSIKKKKWQEMTVKYCKEKNLPLMDHKILSRKWSKSLTRFRGIKSTGGSSSSAPHLNPLSEIVLTAAEANADLSSDFDCEPDYGFDQGKFDYMAFSACHYNLTFL